MTGLELNAIYGAMISPDARVDVPEAWMPAVHAAMQEIVDLPTEVRAFFLVVGIHRDVEGDLTFSTAGAFNFTTNEGLRMVRDIVSRAQDAVSAIKGSVH